MLHRQLNNLLTEPTIIEKYTPITNINFEQLQSSVGYIIRRYHDAIYYGCVVDSKREGIGIMKYTNGRIYEGGWHCDMREGKGYEKYQNGNIYEGEFKEGRADGKGIYKWINGEIYDGEWKIGLKHGDGVWKGIHGDSYIGEWKLSKADGYGVHIWANGDRYEGEWKECLKHGNGTDIFASGDVYIGQYKYGKPYGNGQYIWKNGSSYIGEFKNGIKNGQGKWRKNKEQNANQYEGQYTDDKKQGFGIFKWSSGNIYRGQYANDDREGIGEMRWTDGSVYLGQWIRGIQHGYGKMIFPDGSIKEGYFDNNIFKGELPNDEIVPNELLDKGFNISKLDPLGRQPPITRTINAAPIGNGMRSKNQSMISFIKTKSDFNQPYKETPKMRSNPVKAMRTRYNNSSLMDSESISSDVKLPHYNKSMKRTELMTHTRVSQSNRILSAKSTESSQRKSLVKKKRSINTLRRVWMPSGKARSIDVFGQQSKPNISYM